MVKKRGLTHIQTDVKNKIPVIDGVKEYAVLKETITKAGILKRSYGYYAVLITVDFFGYFFSAYNLFIQNNLIVVFLWGVVFAFFTVQLAALVHDAGHRAIFKSTRANDAFGIITAILVAMRYESWRVKHNMHHAHPNTDEEDPDFQIPFLSFTKEEYDRKTGLARKLRKYQLLLYYPIGTLVVFSTRIRSIREFISEFSPKLLPELIGFSIIFTTWFILPFFIFPLAKALVIFFVINFVTGFYLFNIFAPNHKGMPKLSKGTRLAFIQQQIMTARNITPNFLNDIIYVGLNYQIEHHLFPNTPRNKLWLLTPYVKKVCKKLRLEYTHVGIIETNKIILSELRQFTK